MGETGIARRLESERASDHKQTWVLFEREIQVASDWGSRAGSNSDEIRMAGRPGFPGGPDLQL